MTFGIWPTDIYYYYSITIVHSILPVLVTTLIPVIHCALHLMTSIGSMVSPSLSLLSLIILTSNLVTSVLHHWYLVLVSLRGNSINKQLNHQSNASKTKMIIKIPKPIRFIWSLNNVETSETHWHLSFWLKLKRIQNISRA